MSTAVARLARAMPPRKVKADPSPSQRMRATSTTSEPSTAGPRQRRQTRVRNPARCSGSAQAIASAAPNISPMRWVSVP